MAAAPFLSAFAAARSGPLTSAWLLVDQARIDGFAQATGDHQFIHVDPTRAAVETPYGGTIAHGLLTLSLLPGLAYATMPEIPGRRMSVNYGYDRIRFVTPVRAGKRVRAHFTLVDTAARADGSVRVVTDAVMEIEAEAKPALVARSIALSYFA